MLPDTHAPPGRESRPGGETEAAENRWAATSNTALQATDYLTRHTARCVQEAVDLGLAATWRRRAAAFRAARPLPTDYPGQATRTELSSRWRELSTIADACEARAEVSLRHEDLDPDVLAAVEEAVR